MKKKILFSVALSLSMAFSLAAQRPADDPRQTDDPTREREERRWQFRVKGAGHVYDNFFQVSGDGETVTALNAEVGASLAIAAATRLYGSVNAIRFDEEGLGTARGVRLGISRQARPHAFDVFADYAADRPSFDVGDEFDRATIRMIAGEYSYRFAEDWQVSFDGELQRQEYELTMNRDNRYGGAGAAIRWRGNRRFSPEIGLRVGDRDVDDTDESYGQRDAYLQIRSSVTPDLYLSLRFRDRSRDYDAASPAASNFGREDTRRQVAFTAVYSLTPAVDVDLYATRERVDSSRAGRDFETGLFVLGLTWKF